MWLLILGQYTGVLALAILFGIVVLSIPYIRHRFYETFYFSHFFLAIAYLGALFLAFGPGGRLVGLPLGNIGAVVIVNPRPGVLPQPFIQTRQPVADRDPSSSPSPP